MGNKFRKLVRFQLFNVPNDLKHRAQRAGEEWADNGGYCGQCKEFRKPMMVTAGKDPKDGKRFMYFLCAGCVQKIGQMKAQAKPEEILKEALGNLLQGKADMEKEQAEENPSLTNDPASQAEFNDQLIREQAEEKQLVPKVCDRSTCTKEAPMPAGASGRWEHPDAKEVGDDGYVARYSCPNCGLKFSVELPE